MINLENFRIFISFQGNIKKLILKIPMTFYIDLRLKDKKIFIDVNIPFIFFLITVFGNRKAYITITKLQIHSQFWTSQYLYMVKREFDWMLHVYIEIERPIFYDNNKVTNLIPSLIFSISLKGKSGISMNDICIFKIYIWSYSLGITLFNIYLGV